MPIVSSKAMMLEAGLDILSTHGVSGSSLGRVAQAAGLSKSGLFAHVRSKDQLAMELFDAGARLADRSVVAPAMRQPDGLVRLLALIEGWLGWSARAGLSGGCPIAAAMFELDDSDGPVRDHVKVLETQWRSLLSALVDEAISRGELRADLDRDQFIWELCGIYLCHHTSSRFLGDPAADRRAHRAVDSLVERAGGVSLAWRDDPC